MNIFVISIKESIQRREKISAQLNALHLQFEYIDAIVGKDHYDDPLCFNLKKCMQYEKRKLLPGEVGCAASHIAVYKKIIERNLPYAFILEDDAIISSDVPQILSILENHIQQNDLITLERCDIYSKKNMIPLYKEYKLVHPLMIKYGSICQAAGYIITREAAKKIAVFNMPVCVPADSWEHYRKSIFFKGIIPSQILIHQDMSQNSTIVDGIRDTSGKTTVFSLLFYAFHTRFSLGIFLKKIYKKMMHK